MTKPNIPLGSDEDSPESTADYHHGSDNSIKNAMRTVKECAEKKGVKLSGVDDKDIDEVKEPDDAQKPKIKDPPPRKATR
jgi:hypothetical protein